ncbi:MAG: hypothetical protein EXR66_03905 [Dehalococcoidia bacterium]|nr:hypothetical protein [Dehalococcoidia bacterium]
MRVLSCVDDFRRELEGFPHGVSTTKAGIVGLQELLGKFRPDPLRAHVEASVQRGTGLHKGEWLRDELPLSPEQCAVVSEEILDWCREQMAASRKPYGIDQMALAVACAEPGGVPLASKTFGVFRPVDFYQPEGVAERVS